MQVFRAIAALVAIPAVVVFGCTGSDSPQAAGVGDMGAITSTSAAQTVCNPQPMSITSNFNGTPIKAGDVIWFSAVFKPSGLGATPVHLFYRNGTITLPGFPPIAVPDADITLTPGATSATTTLVAGHWITNLPTSFSGNAFLSGVAVPVPSGLPGGVSPVTWSGTLTADVPVQICWKWAAAVYTQFPDIAAPAVKAVDDNHFPPYLSSDHAGTPEDDKAFVTGGARGGGGANYTGSLSGTMCFTAPPCGCIPDTTCPPGQSCGTAPDNCGGTIDCGTCTPPSTCGGGGTPSECGCTPATTCPPGQSCGTAPDGCGGTIDCGTCTPPDTCVSGICQPPSMCAMSGTGPNHIVCECISFIDGTTSTLEACGSCDTAAETCEVVCGVHASNSAVQECDQTTSCGSGPPPPPQGQCLTACRCQDGSTQTVCAQCTGNGPGSACDNACASCGGLAQQTNLMSPAACCTPATTCPPGQSCGTAPDGCGGTIDCGTCGPFEVCAGGTCQTTCTQPVSSGPDRVQCFCGPDGSNGTVNVCATCGFGEIAACNQACATCGGYFGFAGCFMADPSCP